MFFNTYVQIHLFASVAQASEQVFGSATFTHETQSVVLAKVLFLILCVSEAEKLLTIAVLLGPPAVFSTISVSHTPCNFFGMPFQVTLILLPPSSMPSS